MRHLTRAPRRATAATIALTATLAAVLALAGCGASPAATSAPSAADASAAGSGGADAVPAAAPLAVTPDADASGAGSDGAGSGGAALPALPERPAGPFRFGYIMPETGSLAFLAPPQIAAMNFAIDKINQAGGVNGAPLPAPIAGDEGDDIGLVMGTAKKELDAHVDAIIGAAATGMTMAIVDEITHAGVAECSGTNTGIPLTDYDGKFRGDTQLYFRTAPSDALQGPVLGKLVLSDGHKNVAVIARGDTYGTGLAKATADAITAGGGTVVANETYSPKATSFADIVAKVAAAKPDAIVTVSFDEGFTLWQELFDAGLTPKTVGFYGADGMHSTDAPKKFKDPSILDGAGGTAPTSVDNPSFLAALKAFAPDLKETQFATQVFDCATIFALAAEQAKSNDAMTWAPLVPGITTGGTTCTSYAACKPLVDRGVNIHYVGASGDLAFTDKGEPGIAHVEVWRYQNGGQLVSQRVEKSTVK